MKIRYLSFCALPLLVAACGGQKDAGEELGSTQAAVTGVFETNKFFGQVGFSNDAAGTVGQRLVDNIGTHGCSVYSGSTSVSGLSASTSAPGNGLFCDYELSSETQAGGIVYNLSAHRAGYSFQAVPNNALEPKAASPSGTEVDIAECVGMTQVSFEDCDGNVVEPHNVSLGAPYFKSGTSWYAFHRDGASGDLSVTYTTGADPYDDLLRSQNSVPFSAVCDELEPQVIELCGGETGELGALSGPVQMVGETLLRSVGISAYYGPAGNERHFLDQASPFERTSPSDYWVLGKMMPGDYQVVFADLNVRTGYGHTQMRVPYVPATVVAGQTTVIEQSGKFPFVVTPSTIEGSIVLTNPSFPDAGGSQGTLGTLFRAADQLGADGLPTQHVSGGSFVTASTDAWGSSTTSFPGAFDAAAHGYSTTYDLPVASSYDQTRTFNDYMRLWFRAPFAANDASTYRYGYLDVSGTGNAHTLAAGDVATEDYNVCFSEVELDMLLLGGDSLYEPTVSISGNFSGANGNGVTTAYNVSGAFYGSPTTQPTRSTDGRVFFTLPQGRYQLTPSARVVNTSGIESSVNFSKVSVDVGCGQNIVVRPGLGVSVTLASECAGTVSTSANVSVSSGGLPVDRVWYTVNDGAPIEICASNCGADPSYEIDVPTSALSACSNSFQVFAESSAVPGDEASTGMSLVHEVPGDNIDCPGDCVEEPPEGGACLIGTEFLDIRDRTKIGTDASGGRVEIGADALVSGDVDSAGNAFVRERGKVTGVLSVEGAYTHQNGVSLGSLVNPADVTLPTLPTKTVSAGTGWAEVPNGAVRTLAPGQYGNMTIRARSTVTLTAGTYSFASLKVEPDVTLVLDTSAGAIALDVQGDVAFESRIVYVSSDPSKLSVYSNGSSVRLHPEQTFPGSILAPNAEISVYSHVKVNGCLAGRVVRIEPDSELVGGTPVVGGGDTGGTGGSGGTGGTGGGGGSGGTGGTGGGGQTSSLTGSLTVTSNWDNGYCVDVRVTNPGTSTVSAWTATVNLGAATLNGSWNGTFATNGNVATVTPVGWNATLAPSASQSFGFCAAKTQANTAPSLTSVE